MRKVEPGGYKKRFSDFRVFVESEKEFKGLSKESKQIKCYDFMKDLFRKAREDEIALCEDTKFRLFKLIWNYRRDYGLFGIREISIIKAAFY